MYSKKDGRKGLDELSSEEKDEYIGELRKSILICCVALIVMMFVGIVLLGLFGYDEYRLRHVNDRYADIVLEGDSCSAGNLSLAQATLRFDGLNMDTVKYMNSHLSDLPLSTCRNVSIRMFVYGYSP